MAKLQIDIDVSGQSKVTQLDNSLKNLDKTTKTTTTDSEKVAASIKKIATAAIAYVAIDKLTDSLTNISKSLVGTSAQFEQFEAVLTTIEGSATKAEDSLKWVEDFSSSTPFNIDKITESFVKLKAYGLEPTDGLLRTLGDTASAMGKDIEQAVEAIADAVVGENERLKEFGIKANIIGDDIKYSWTNASGEMRTTIVQNNSEIIQSTLEAIFNSKYEGAMELQSKTWNGMVSNMQDKWTLFKKDVMDEGLFAYLKSIVTVAGDRLTEAFGNAKDMGKAFADYTIDAIKGVISTAGVLYDAFDIIGNSFDVLKYAGEKAFYGIELAGVKVADSTLDLFESMFNSIIGWTNDLIAGINSLGIIEIGYIGKVDFSSYKQQIQDFAQVDAIAFDYGLSSENLEEAISNVLNVGKGQTFTDELIKDIDETYKAIKDDVVAVADKQYFGETQTAEPGALLTPTDEQVEAQDNITQAVEDANNALDDLKETFVATSGDDDVYTVFTETQEVIKDATEIVSDANNAFSDANDTLENFVFEFENTFINSLKRNANTLRNVGSNLVSYQSVNYEQALNDVLAVRSKLIDNPLDKDIGEQYADAFNQFSSSVSDYLSDTSHFTTAEELQFASVTADVQTRELQSTAMDTYDVLESMNDLLFSINKAYEDGILTDEEKETIAGVADDVNAKNEVLLGHRGVLVPTVDDLNEAINEQEYYNNSGLATDRNISSQEYYNNSGLAKSDDLGNIGKIKLTGHGSLKTYDYTSSKKLDTNINETNTVGNFVEKLMGGESKGISLTSIASTLPDLSVDTGLDVGDISNLKITSNGNLKTFDVTAKHRLEEVTDETKNVTGAVDDANIKGDAAKTLDDIAYSKTVVQFTGSYGEEDGKFIKKETTVTTTGPAEATDLSTGIDWSGMVDEHDSSSMSWYANGGFTGRGAGARDSTGYKQAGIVHEDEWVAPKWMIDNNKGLFNTLEQARLKGFANGGFTSKTVTKAMNGLSDKTEKYMFILVDEMKRLNGLIRSMSNGGDTLLVEVV